MVGRRGYFVLEAAVGVALAAVVAVSVAGVLRARAESVRHAYEEVVAREIAGARLERLEAAGWAGLAEGRRGEAVDDPGSENLAELEATVSVAALEGGGRTVDVEVSWAPVPGRRRSVQLRTVAP